MSMHRYYNPDPCPRCIKGRMLLDYDDEVICINCGYEEVPFEQLSEGQKWMAIVRERYETYGII